MSQLEPQARKIILKLKKRYPDARCALRHKNPLELLVATILSAQCTDERVNKVTLGLFRTYKKAEDYAHADVAQFEQDIRSTGFFRNKARSIIGCCKELVEKHKGQVPRTLEKLVRLPGIGRKTANVILGVAYGVSEGVVVDTHVKRVSFRLGLTHKKDPEKIERDLMKILPQKDWIDFSHLLIFHGRNICVARKPKCDICPVKRLCEYYKKIGEK